MNFSYPKDNKLANNPSEAPIKSNGSPASIFKASSCKLFLTLVFVPAHNQGVRYINKDLQKAIKFLLDLFV